MRLSTTHEYARERIQLNNIRNSKVSFHFSLHYRGKFKWSLTSLLRNGDHLQILNANGQVNYSSFSWSNHHLKAVRHLVLLTS